MARAITSGPRPAPSRPQSFDHQAIEAKWQTRWEADRLYEADVDPSRPKHYALVMFPYTSGDLHLGHWWNFALADIHTRYMRMRGFNVLFPPGFDAFGLPTEGAAISAFAAIVIGFATRTLTLRGLSDAFLETVYSSAMLFFIIVGAFIFARFIVLTRLPNELAVWVQAAQLSPLAIVLAVIVLYVVLGTALEEVSTILITVPVILPIMAGIGYDGIWFGIFVTVMATIGLISPPVGLTVFVIQAQNPDIPAAKIYRGTLPFLVADFVLVALLVAFPALALWLPSVLKV